MPDMSEPWSKVASLYDGWRAVGGSLRVGNDRLTFKAHAVDRALNGREVDFPLASIARLTLTERTLKAPRRHVLVETRDGVRARFLVNGAKGVIARLSQDALAAGAAPEVIGVG